MDLRVLGPVEVWADGRPRAANRPQQTTVLAVLAVDANHLVQTETLIDRVWGDQPPARARRTLHTHLSRVRRLLAPAAGTPGGPRLLRRSGGYLLDVDPDRVDLHRYRSLVDRAGEQAPPGGAGRSGWNGPLGGAGGGQRVTLLREAMGLWRGDPLAGVPGEWAGRVRQAWRQHHLGAVVTWARAEVEAGNPAAVVGPLTLLVGDHPLVECLVGALMRALHAAGQTAAALDHYRRARRRLIDEIGVEPGAELRAAHHAVLCPDEAVARLPIDQRSGRAVACR